MKNFILINLLLLSCTEKGKAEKADIYYQKKVDAKVCVHLCVKQLIKSLHTSSKATLGGASSSSLNGFTQDQTFPNFKNHCVELIGDNCCERGYRDSLWPVPPNYIMCNVVGMEFPNR